MAVGDNRRHHLGKIGITETLAAQKFNQIISGIGGDFTLFVAEIFEAALDGIFREDEIFAALDQPTLEKILVADFLITIGAVADDYAA